MRVSAMSVGTLRAESKHNLDEVTRTGVHAGTQHMPRAVLKRVPLCHSRSGGAPDA